MIDRSLAVSVRLRVGVLVVAVIPLGLLVVASCLSPNDRGLGTHQQLGLPPCTALLLLGVRCPACGMTTSWSHFVRGDWIASFQANAGGFLLAGYCLVAAVIAFRVAIQGAWPTSMSRSLLVWGLVSVAAVTAVDWVVRLVG